MSYQVGSACYPTAALAAGASASSQIGSVIELGSASYVVDQSSVTDTTITYLLSPVGGGTPITITSSYTAVPCGLLTASDALELGWSVVAVWIAVYSLMFLYRAMRGETGDSYGNS